MCQNLSVSPLIFLFPLSQEVSLHPLLTSSDSQLHSFSLIFFFQHDLCISFTSILKAIIFPEACSQRKSDSCVFLLKYSETFYVFFFHHQSLNFFPQFYILFQFISLPLFLCFSNLFVRYNYPTTLVLNFIYVLTLRIQRLFPVFVFPSFPHFCTTTIPAIWLPNRIQICCFSCFLFCHNMWSTFFVTDEEGRTMGPVGTGTPVTVAPGGAAQGSAGLANLMSGRSTFGGNKRRRTTSTGHTMSEAQEGKVTALIVSFLPQAV